MTYQTPKPRRLPTHGNPYAEGYTAAQMTDAYQQGQRDMREAAAEFLTPAAYAESYDKAAYKRGLAIAELVRELPINAELSAPAGATRTPGYRAGTKLGDK